MAHGNSNFRVEQLENWYEHDQYLFLNILPERELAAVGVANEAADAGANVLVVQEQVNEAPNKGKEHLKEQSKLQILQLYMQGLSARQIGLEINKSHTAINRFLKLWREENKLKKEETRGRKAILTEGDIRNVIVKVKRDRFITVKKIQLEMPHLNVSVNTISKAIKSTGEFNSYWAARKPFISQINRIKRYRWAKMHSKWSIQRWRRVLFTDESPFCLRYNGKIRVWRSFNERYTPRCCKVSFKHDEKINVWGGFCASGVGLLRQVDGIMDAIQYVAILGEAATPSIDLLFGGNDYIFQQDNDPKHTAILTRQYMVESNMPLMPWPPQSPDLNPIENLWSILDRKLMNRRVNSKQELFQTLDTCWRELPVGLLNDLVDSMPTRIDSVIQCRGGPTKY